MRGSLVRAHCPFNRDASEYAENEEEPTLKDCVKEEEEGHTSIPAQKKLLVVVKLVMLLWMLLVVIFITLLFPVLCGWITVEGNATLIKITISGLYCAFTISTTISCFEGLLMIAVIMIYYVKGINWRLFPLLKSNLSLESTASESIIQNKNGLAADGCLANFYAFISAYLGFQIHAYMKRHDKTIDSHAVRALLYLVGLLQLGHGIFYGFAIWRGQPLYYSRDIALPNLFVSLFWTVIIILLTKLTILMAKSKKEECHINSSLL